MVLTFALEFRCFCEFSKYNQEKISKEYQTLNLVQKRMIRQTLF
jgi:hypothetical protein